MLKGDISLEGPQQILAHAGPLDDSTQLLIKVGLESPRIVPIISETRCMSSVTIDHASEGQELGSHS